MRSLRRGGGFGRVTTAYVPSERQRGDRELLKRLDSLKNERAHGTRCGTRAIAETDLFDYIEPFYNRKHRHSTLRYSSPAKVFEDWISTQHEQQVAA